MNLISNTNLLCGVLTRIDFNDLYSLSPSTIKKVKKVANSYELVDATTRMLTLENDFSSNDSVNFQNYPSQYIKESTCNAFFNEKATRFLEINQFFIRFMILPDYKNHNRTISNEDYECYEKSVLELLGEVINIFEEEEEINGEIIRISVKKIDCKTFKTLEEMNKIFKKELILSNVFGNRVDWDVPNAASSIEQNFKYDDRNVNFQSRINRVASRTLEDRQYKSEILYNLFLGYEVYTRKNIPTDSIIEELKKINEIERSLFYESFDEEGKKLYFNEKD